MADSPNTGAPQTNIDDLVKELSRPQGSPPAPSSAPSMGSTLPSIPSRPVALTPVPSTIPRPAGPPPGMPNTSPVTPPKPTLPPTPSGSPVAPVVPKEYQSSIRTMSDDLSKLKAGQQPQGVNVPRKIDNTPVPVKPTVPTTPVPTPSKSQISATLPSANKSAPLPSMPSQQPKAPASSPIPRPVMPIMPPPTKAQEMKPGDKNQFYVPPAEAKSAGSGSSRNLVFAGIAVAVVLLGSLYWYFMIRSSGDQVAVESPVVTFTPRPTATPNLDVLSAIFTTRGGTIVLPSAGDPASAFSNAINIQPNITPGTLTAINIASGASSSVQTLTVVGLLNRFVASYPPALQTALGQNYKFLLYGQKESFDAKGRPVANSISGSRLVMVSEITSSSAVILQDWEPTMSANLTGIMMIKSAQNTGPFLATVHNGASVRFKNFPYPDHSIDYALIQYNGKTYLVIAGSREAMFATIDTFVGAVPGK